jgi:hypothetical protein
MSPIGRGSTPHPCRGGGFGMPEALLRTIMGPAAHRTRHRIYVGYADGLPVTSGLGARTGRTMGIFNTRQCPTPGSYGAAAMTDRIALSMDGPWLRRGGPPGERDTSRSTSAWGTGPSSSAHRLRRPSGLRTFGLVAVPPTAQSPRTAAAPCSVDRPTASLRATESGGPPNIVDATDARPAR